MLILWATVKVVHHQLVSKTLPPKTTFCTHLWWTALTAVGSKGLFYFHQMKRRNRFGSLSNRRLKFFRSRGYKCHYCGSELWDLLRSLVEAKEFKVFWRSVCDEAGCELDQIPANHLATIDHKLALFNGGDDREDNIVPSCKSCNSSKGIR
jgi:hypothetical protein